MCVAVDKGNFVPALARKLAAGNMFPATLPVKNGSAVFSVNLK
jgi:hypothetical protein